MKKEKDYSWLIAGTIAVLYAAGIISFIFALESY